METIQLLRYVVYDGKGRQINELNKKSWNRLANSSIVPNAGAASAEY
ncbi:MAG: hypothetical protein R2788_03470 [Saprospiraceae bacterium]